MLCSAISPWFGNVDLRSVRHQYMHACNPSVIFDKIVLFSMGYET